MALVQDRGSFCTWNTTLYSKQQSRRQFSASLFKLEQRIKLNTNLHRLEHEK